MIILKEISWNFTQKVVRNIEIIESVSTSDQVINGKATNLAVFHIESCCNAFNQGSKDAQGSNRLGRARENVRRTVPGTINPILGYGPSTTFEQSSTA